MFEALLEQVVNGLMMGSIYVLVALGMVLIYGVMHVLNFAHGVLFMLGGYASHFFFVRVTGDYISATLLSMTTLFVVGMALERYVFRALRDNLQNQVLASLGLILIIQNLVITLWGPTALQLKVRAADIMVPLGVMRFSLLHFVAIFVAMGCIALLYVYLTRTRFGTAIRATSQNHEAALVVGIDVNRMYLVTFAGGTALAALGGALLGPMFLIFPQMGDLPLLKALAAILLGGMGSIWGAVVGGLLIGVVEAVSTVFIATGYKDSITFMALVLILLFRPQGLFGIRVRGKEE
jgi:branched-chain amino acid transport system permease protein